MQITATYNGYYPTQTNFQGIKITPTTKQWNELRVFPTTYMNTKKV